MNDRRFGRVQREKGHLLDLVDYETNEVYVHYDSETAKHLHSNANNGKRAYVHSHVGGEVPHEHGVP